MDDTGHLRLIGTMEEGAQVKPDHRISVGDHTGKNRTGRIDLVEEQGENGELSLRIDNAHASYFEGVELEGKTGKILLNTTGADMMIASGYGPPRWWVGFAMVGMIGLIIWSFGISILAETLNRSWVCAFFGSILSLPFFTPPFHP